MPRGRKRKPSNDPLAAYRRVRKPVARPSRVLPNERLRLREEAAEKEAREAEDEARREEGDR